MTNLTTTEAAPQPADAHLTSGPPVVGDTSSFAPFAELARTLVEGGLATLSTLTESGHPFGSIVPTGVLPNGSALICVSELAEHTKNLRRVGRSSLLFVEPASADADPLSLARVTLTGEFVPFTPEPADTEQYFTRHPHARDYAHFDDFAWWRFEIAAVRYVGGFGVMGWCEPADLLAAQPDPVIPNAAPMIDHLNADHADSCLAIVQVLASCPDAVSAVVTGLDRYGVTFDVRMQPTTAQPSAIARVAFPAPLDAPSQVRGATVDLVGRARPAS